MLHLVYIPMLPLTPPNKVGLPWIGRGCVPGCSITSDPVYMIKKNTFKNYYHYYCVHECIYHVSINTLNVPGKIYKICKQLEVVNVHRCTITKLFLLYKKLFLFESSSVSYSLTSSEDIDTLADVNSRRLQHVTKILLNCCLTIYVIIKIT